MTFGDALEQIFQSTLLMRGATSSTCAQDCGKSYFNPRSSCEERRARRRHLNPKIRISIHAPHARSDVTRLASLLHGRLFQSTLLMRGATHHGKSKPRQG